MKRRSLLSAGVTLGAAAAGAGWAWWRGRAQAPADDGAALWNLSFEQPAGGRLVMAELRGQALLVNFWASWCAPCVREMPELDRFQRDFGARGWRVVGLAIDDANPVREFLLRRPVGFTIGLASAEGLDLARRLGNTAGALPFTVAFDRTGRPVQRKLGQTHYEELVGWAAARG